MRSNIADYLSSMDGVVICLGFGQRGTEGKIIAAVHTTYPHWVYVSVCLKNANSREMNPSTPYNVIDLMEEQKSITQIGGTMRLGAYSCDLLIGSKAYEASFVQ